jgi:hypothetical protein
MRSDTPLHRSELATSWRKNEGLSPLSLVTTVAVLCKGEQPRSSLKQF